MPTTPDGEPRWRATTRYWKGCGLVLWAAAFVTGWTTDGSVIDGAGLAVVVSPLVFWLFRIAAWETDTELVVRNLFGTKRIPWGLITRLEVRPTIWSTDWAYVSVRHGIGTTHIKALVVAYPLPPDRVLDEARDLAQRRGLPFDESWVGHLRASRSGRKGPR